MSGPAHSYPCDHDYAGTTYLDPYVGFVGYADPAAQAHYRPGSSAHQPAHTHGHSDICGANDDPETNSHSDVNGTHHCPNSNSNSNCDCAHRYSDATDTHAYLAATHGDQTTRAYRHPNASPG